MALSLHSQDAPVTSCPVLTLASAGPVSVPITVTGFTNIGAISLSLDYNYSVMHFTQGTPHPSMPNFLSGDYDLGNGFHRVNMSWYGSSNSLADGSTIITLHFNYISGNTALTWYDNGSSCEYADVLGNSLNDMPSENFYINGSICRSIADPGQLTGNDSVCRGQAGEIYSVLSLPDVTGYHWTVPEGAEIINGQNTNSITVDFGDTAVSGLMAVYAFNDCGNGPSSQLGVTVSLLPVSDAGNDTTINYGTSTTLHAVSGGSGTYSYHWSPEEWLVDPDVQNPQTIILTSTVIFSLVVTDQASSCQNSDEIIVAITGGPLSINPVAIPGEICSGEYTQLYSNAGGGSGNYYYQWTCLPQDDPPWGSAMANPLVSPDSNRQYFLNVSDGFTDVSGSVSLPVFSLPTATISGGDSLCGTGSTAILPVGLTGTPPWSFIYSNGITSVNVSGQLTTPYEIITGDPGTWTILELQDAACTGQTFGSATIYVFPVPAPPGITVLGTSLISSVCCGNQWYLNDEPIPGATGQVYEATESGWYFDIVTLNGCSSDTSESVDMTVGIRENDGPAFSLYPNPADNFVRINIPGEIKGSLTITVKSADGREAARFIYSSVEIENQLSFDISRLSAGLYFVEVSSHETRSVCKLLVL